MDWENVKILDFEPKSHIKLISEMIHIKEQKNSLNLNKDTELLDESHFNILNLLTAGKFELKSTSY